MEVTPWNYYSSELKTRKVSRTAREVRSIIRDHEGRIDGDNTSEKNASIRFVIPKSELDSFIGDIEEIVPAKFYIENTSSENLLGQKQSIEEQTTTTQKSLTDLQAQQKSLSANHSARIKSIQESITNYSYQLSLLQKNLEGATTTGPENIRMIQEKNNIENILRNLNTQLSQENTNYENQKNILKSQINQVSGQLGNLKTQDTQLMQQVETVTGTISINWVSIWDMVKLYVPLPPVVIIIILALVAWYILVRKNVIPMIAIGW